MDRLRFAKVRSPDHGIQKRHQHRGKEWPFPSSIRDEFAGMAEWDRYSSVAEVFSLSDHGRYIL